MAVRSDQPGHRRAVAIRVGPTIARGSRLHIGAGQHVADQIWMRPIHSRVDHRDDYPGTLAVAVRLRRPQEPQLPLPIPHTVRPYRTRWDGHRDQRRHQCQRTRPQLMRSCLHRSIPITPGPGSCRISRSGGGSNTEGTPGRNGHSVSGGIVRRSRRSGERPEPTPPPNRPPSGPTPDAPRPAESRASAASCPTDLLAGSTAGAPITAPDRNTLPTGVSIQGEPGGPSPPGTPFAAGIGWSDPGTATGMPLHAGDVPPLNADPPPAGSATGTTIGSGRGITGARKDP